MCCSWAGCWLWSSTSVAEHTMLDGSEYVSVGSLQWVASYLSQVVWLLLKVNLKTRMRCIHGLRSSQSKVYDTCSPQSSFASTACCSTHPSRCRSRWPHTYAQRVCLVVHARHGYMQSFTDLVSTTSGSILDVEADWL